MGFLPFFLLFFGLTFASSHNIAVTENDPSTLVNGVSVVTGHFYSYEQDYLVEGAEPIPIRRPYISNGTSMHDYPHLIATFAWQFNMLLVNEPNGTRIRYTADAKNPFVPVIGDAFFGKNKKVMSLTYRSEHTSDEIRGMSNTSSGSISAQTNLQNQYLVFDANRDSKGKSFTLFAADGTERRYVNLEKQKKEPIPFGSGGEYSFYQYKLVSETLPNGHVVHYVWDHDNQLKRVFTSSKNEKKVFASLYFPSLDPTKPMKQLKITGSDGRFTQYSGKEYGKEKTLLLNRVISPNLPPQNFEWQKQEWYLRTQWQFPNKRTFFIHYGDGPYYRVHSLASAVGSGDQPITTHTFSYKQNQTDVQDAKGYKTSYFYNDQYRLTHIDRFTEEDKLFSSERFIWDGVRLQSKWLVDQNEQPLFLYQYSYDPQGNVTKKTFFGNLSGEGESLQVDSQGHPIQNNVESYAITYIYTDSKRNLVKEENHANGLSLRYEYLPETNLPTCKEIFNLGELVVRHLYTYNDENILVQESIYNGQSTQIKKIYPIEKGPYLGLPEILEEKYLDGTREVLLQKTVFEYTDGAKISQKSIYDANNQYQYTLYYTYEKEQIKTETNAIGQRADHKYDELGNCIYTKDPSGRLETFYTYDFSNRLTKKIEQGFDGITRTYTYSYDTKHNLETETDFRGHLTQYKYNALDQKVQAQGPKKANHHYQYDSSGNQILHTDPEGHTIQTTYNARGNPIKVLYPDNTTEEKRYSIDGTLKSHTDPSGITTTYAYDSFGRMISKMTANAKETYHYTGLVLTKKIDSEGNETTYTYDKAGRKASETFAGDKTLYTYDSLGRVSQTQKGDLVQIHIYNLLNQIIEEREETSSGAFLTQTHYSYDEAGNQTEIIKAGSKTSLTYDSQNRLTQKTNALGATETIQYNDHFLNSRGEEVLQKIHTDPMGLQTLETHDPLGRVVRIEKKKGETLSLTCKKYDLNGRLIHQTDTVFSPHNPPREIETAYTYDSRNRLITLVEGNEKTTSYTYTANGKQKTVTKPSGVTLFYDYNDLDQLISIRSSDKTVSHHMSYNKLGHLLKTDDIIRTTDPQGHITSETLPCGLTIFSEYQNNKKQKMTLPFFNCLVEYQYRGNQLAQIERKTLQGESLYTHTYNAYDLAGNLLLATLINRERLQYITDPLLRHTSLESPHVAQEIIQYDPVGNILQMRLFDEIKTYTYDDLYQLTSEPNHRYSYDSLNNRLQKDENLYTVNSLNQLTSHLEYDLDGNPIQYKDQSFTYDALGRLIRIATPTQIQTFEYDSLNRCKAKKTLQNDTYTIQYFLHDGQNEIASYKSDHTKELRILGLTNHAEIGSSVAIELNEIPHTPIHDLQGNLAALIPLNDTPATYYHYTAFGEEEIDGPSFCPWRFSSKRTDETTGLINFGRRYYIPELGRWLTPDPAGFTDGMNLYAYVHNDPLTHLDAYGLTSFPIADRVDTLGYFPHLSYPSRYLQSERSLDYRRMHGSRFMPSLNPDPGLAKMYNINGMWNSLSDHISGSRKLFETYGGRANIIPSYSTTFGKLNDLKSVFHARNRDDYTSDFVEQFSRKLQFDTIALQAMGDKRKVFINCFSRGSTDVYHAVKNFTREQKDCLVITACGPTKILPRNLGFIVKNLISAGDRYSNLLNHQELNDPNLDDYAHVHILPQIDGFHGIKGDHFFQSKTYQKGILDYCVRDYEKYGVYRE